MTDHEKAIHVRILSMDEGDAGDAPTCKGCESSITTDLKCVVFDGWFWICPDCIERITHKLKTAHDLASLGDHIITPLVAEDDGLHTVTNGLGKGS